MKRVFFLLLSFLFLTSACNRRLSLKAGDLTGYCGVEGIGTEKVLLCFVSDSTYRRTGDLYIETDGSYFIKADTLYINFGCENCAGTEGITKKCCSQQSYVLHSEKTLKIVGWREASGKTQPIPRQYQKIELFKK